MIESHKLAQIARCRPDLVLSIESCLARYRDRAAFSDQEVVFVTGRRGKPSLQLAGRWIHSAVAPDREADRLAENLLRSEPDAIVVFGLGLGYQLEALRKRRRGLTILVIEPSPEVLDFAVDHRPVSWWCSYGPDLILAPEDQDQLSTTLNRSGSYTPALMTLQAVAQAFPDHLRELETTLRWFRQRRKVNRNTLRRFGRLWVRNTLRNLHTRSAQSGLDILRGSVPEMPALVCGAGPTLDAIFPLLEDLRKRCVIITVDTATAALHRAGFYPDVAIVADPQYWNTRHLDAIRPDQTRRTVLVAEPATHPRVFRLWQGPQLLSASLFPLGAFFDRRLGRTQKLGAGGSVATSAWDLARIMGAREIFLAGVDLGFPEFQTHCAGSFFEERLFLRSERLQTAEQGLFRYLHDADPVPVPSAGGDRILSDARMEVYRSWFAERTRYHPDVSTSLLSPHSSAIEGVRYIDPNTILERFPPRAVPDLTSNFADRSRDTLGALGQLESAIEAIDGIARDGSALCVQLREESRAARSTPSDLSRLDEIDARLAGRADRELVGFLAEKALQEATATPVTTESEAILQAERVYQALQDSCEYHRFLLQRYRLDK